MSWPYRQTTRIALVVLLALVVRPVFVGWWQQTHVPDSRAFEFPDSAGYWELGRRLASGEPYQVRSADRQVHRTPGYPLLLAAMFRVVGRDASPTWARGLGAVLGALTVGAVAWLTGQIFGPRAAWVAAAIVALYTEAIATSVLPLSDGPFCLWMVLQLGLWCWAANHERSSRRGLAVAFLAGVVGGVAALTRPSWLLFTPLFVAIWIICSRLERRQFMLGAVMLAGSALVLLSWWIRNYQVVGRFVATSLWVGPSLYDGLNPTADGSSNMSFVAEYEVKLRAADAANPPSMTAPPFEYRFDRMLWDDALRWARENPMRALRLAGINLARQWKIRPNESQFRGWATRLVIAGTDTPVFLLAACGAWRFCDRRQAMLILILPAIYFSLIHAILIGSLRYRQPAMLMLAVLAAATLEDLWFRLTDRTTRFASPIHSH